MLSLDRAVPGDWVLRIGTAATVVSESTSSTSGRLPTPPFHTAHRPNPVGLDMRLEGGGSFRVHADGMAWAARRHGFDEEGWEGAGGFRCLESPRSP